MLKNSGQSLNFKQTDHNWLIVERYYSVGKNNLAIGLNVYSSSFVLLTVMVHSNRVM